jgi:hypothetical protein
MNGSLLLLVLHILACCRIVMLRRWPACPSALPAQLLAMLFYLPAVLLCKLVSVYVPIFGQGNLSKLCAASHKLKVTLGAATAGAHVPVQRSG